MSTFILLGWFNYLSPPWADPKWQHTFWQWSQNILFHRVVVMPWAIAISIAGKVVGK
jgi:hypothetical protein